MLCFHFPTSSCRTNPSAEVQTTLYGTELQDDIYGNFCVKFSINLIPWPKHVQNVSLAQLRPLHVLLIFKNYTESLSGMLRLMYGLLNCFEQTFKCSFITRRKNKQANKKQCQTRTSEKVPVWEKKQNKRMSSPHQVKLRTKWPQNSSQSEEVSSCLYCGLQQGMEGKSTARDRASSCQQPQLCKQGSDISSY